MKTDLQKFQQIARIRAKFKAARKAEQYSRAARINAVLLHLPSLIENRTKYQTAGINEFYAQPEHAKAYFKKDGSFRKGWTWVTGE